MDTTAAALLVAAAVCAAAVLWAGRPPRGLYLPAGEAGAVVPEGARSLGLLAHYSESPELCPNLVEYARQLCREFEVVVLLTNQARPANAHALPANCRVVPVPSNHGLDFGKWAYLLHALPDRPLLQRVGLFNDSVYVVRDLAPFFERAAGRGWRVWGMTSSEEGGPHIQSYFVVAEGPAAARHLLDFFRERRIDHVAAPGYTKVDLVSEFEVGLSRHLAAEFPLRALYSTRSLGPGVPADANPTLRHWDALVLRRGMPLLKKTRDDVGVPGREVLRRLRHEPAAATVDEAAVDARVTKFPTPVK